MSRPFTPPTKRFWEKVAKGADDECWIWLGCTRTGYGQFNLGGNKGKRIGAHRFAWIERNGPVPDGLELDHLCRNRGCVNPAHLEPVTTRENVLRGETIPAKRVAQTHCVRGHEFTPENTIIKDGCRTCRACRDERNRARYPNARRKIVNGIEVPLTPRERNAYRQRDRLGRFVS